MRSSHVWIISVALVIATAIASAASVLGGRYTIITIAGNNVAWKLDRHHGPSLWLRGNPSSARSAFPRPTASSTRNDLTRRKESPRAEHGTRALRF